MGIDQEITTPVLEQYTTSALSELVDEQLQESDIPIVDKAVFSSWRRTMKAFKDSGRFSPFYYQHAQKGLLSGYSKEEVQQYWRGRLFQDLSEIYLCSDFQDTEPEGILLSSERTLILYEELYPNKIRREQLFDLNSLMNVSVPDNLFVVPSKNGSWHIKYWIETSAEKKISRYDDKINGFTKQQNGFSYLFSPDVKILLTMSRSNSWLPSLAHYRDVYSFEVPVDYDRLIRQVEGDYHNHIAGDYSIPLSDICNEMVYQRQRAITNLRCGNMTVEEAIFFLRQQNVSDQEVYSLIPHHY